MVTAFFSKCVCVWGGGGYSKRISIAKNNRQIFYKISWGWGAGLVGGWRVLPLIKIYKSEPLISFFQVHTQKNVAVGLNICMQLVIKRLKCQGKLVCKFKF